MQKLEKIIDELGAYICDDLCYYRETSMDKNDEEMEAICSGCKAGEYLEAIRKHMNYGWIPVEERLPEKEYYTALCVTDKNHYCVAVYNREYGFRTGDIDVEGEIIAWRPLPEPYSPEPFETRKELDKDSKGVRNNE